MRNIFTLLPLLFSSISWAGDSWNPVQLSFTTLLPEERSGPASLLEVGKVVFPVWRAESWGTPLSRPSLRIPEMGRRFDIPADVISDPTHVTGMPKRPDGGISLVGESTRGETFWKIEIDPKSGEPISQSTRNIQDVTSDVDGDSIATSLSETANLRNC